MTFHHQNHTKMQGLPVEGPMDQPAQQQSAESDDHVNDADRVIEDGGAVSGGAGGHGGVYKRTSACVVLKGNS